MPDRMWSLADFRFDEAIEAAEVYVDRGSGLELTARDEAIAFARKRGANLVAWWPPTADAVPSCIVAKVSLPLRWERADAEGETDEADLVAWRAATARFRRTGLWYGRWGTCRVCGCVLLPDTAADRCHEHGGHNG